MKPGPRKNVAALAAFGSAATVAFSFCGKITSPARSLPLVCVPLRSATAGRLSAHGASVPEHNVRRGRFTKLPRRILRACCHFLPIYSATCTL